MHDLTFEQREGAEPLPQQLKLKELPKPIRSLLWSVIYGGFGEHGDSFVSGPWRGVLRSYWVARLHKPADEFSDYVPKVVEWLKPLIWDGDYARVLGFVEHAMRTLSFSNDPQFAQTAAAILERGGAAYRVLDGRSIVPISSPEEGEAVADALTALRGAAFDGARTHLHNAAQALTAGRHADAVRESIHAVEAVARQLAPGADTLGPALTALEKRGHLHPAMKKGFASLYGYTSDEAGIRHALLEAGDPKVTEADALYMFGACASFAAYLKRRAAEG